MKYVNIILFTVLSWAFAHTKANKEKIDYFGDNNLYSYTIQDTISISHTIVLTKELEWATRLIQSEAATKPDTSRGETLADLDTSKMMLVWTIRNRIDYNKWRGRNTDLFWEIRRPGQVDGYQKPRWYKDLERHNIILAYKSLYGENPLPKSIYFWHNSQTSTDVDHVNDTEGPNGEYIYKIIGFHTFCYAHRILENHPEWI